MGGGKSSQTSTFRPDVSVTPKAGRGGIVSMAGDVGAAGAHFGSTTISEGASTNFTATFQPTVNFGNWGLGIMLMQ